MFAYIEGFTRGLARGSALLGGLVLLAVMLMSVFSISGMALSKLGVYLQGSFGLDSFLLDFAPIPGETELVEGTMAFIIFAFLPLVTFNRGHASVEILTNFLNGGINRLIDLIGDGALLAVSGFVTYRLYLGTLSKMKYGEVSQILAIPLWWSYTAALVAACVFVWVAAFCVIRSTRSLITGKRQKVTGVVH